MANFGETIKPASLINEEGVYVVKNVQNGKFYIGSSNKMLKRRREHFSALNRNAHQNKYLQNAFNKNPLAFVFEAVAYLEDSKIYEQKLLDQYYDNQENCYNFSKTVKYPTMSEDGRKRLSESKKKMHAENPWILEKARKARQNDRVKKIQRETNLKQRQDPAYAKNLAEACRKKLRKYYDVTLIHDNGEELFIGWNLRAFCRKHGFERSALIKTLKGKQKTILGWRIKNG